MYQLSESQIDYILNDISARGVEMEDLQLNLLDHVCCIIEQELEADGDFETFYLQTIEKFYKSSLREVEEETKLLLTFKNYYVMRKVMMNSGYVSSVLILIGLFFKFMHWPGAAICLVLGIGGASLIYIPLLFTVRVKEKNELRDKLQLAAASIAGILMSLGILFKVMHWPFSFQLSLLAMAFLILLFLPIYLVSGVRNPETKTNTITTSMLIVIACGLWFTLVVSPSASRKNAAIKTAFILRNEKILEVERKSRIDSVETKLDAREVFEDCDKLKKLLLNEIIGSERLSDDFDERNILIEDEYVGKYLDNEVASKLAEKLCKDVRNFAKSNPELSPMLLSNSLFETDEAFNHARVYDVFNELSQVQLLTLK